MNPIRIAQEIIPMFGKKLVRADRLADSQGKLAAIDKSQAVIEFDLQGNIPAFIDVTPAKIHEIHTLDVLLPEPGSNKRWLSSLSARARTSAFAVLSLAPSTRAAAYVAIRPFVCRAFTRPSPTPTRCGAFVITMPKRRRTWSS